ncbi:MAG: hypothetical protein HKN26_15055 [Acidimicrobiales bacterium]|nr:hypothetical protein [Acidimicrobiales bacterium]
MAETPFDPTGASDADRPADPDAARDEPALARDEPAVARDELVSAYLDGEATAAEIAQVEGSPELLARVEVFRSLQAPMQAVPAPTPEAQNAAIAAAIAAVTVDPADVATAAAAAVATRSATRRPPWYQRLAPGLVMVCVLAAGLIAAPFILNGGSDDADTSSETATNAFEADTAKTPAMSAAPEEVTGGAAENADDEMSEPEPGEGAMLPGAATLALPPDAYAVGYPSVEALADAVLGDLEDTDAANADALPESAATEAPASTAPVTSDSVTSDFGTTARSGQPLLQFEERCAGDPVLGDMVLGDMVLGDAVIYESLILPNRDVFVLVNGPDAAVLIIDAGNCAVLFSS